jgi:hypothetical protein
MPPGRSGQISVGCLAAAQGEFAWVSYRIPALPTWNQPIEWPSYHSYTSCCNSLLAEQRLGSHHGRMGATTSTGHSSASGTHQCIGSTRCGCRGRHQKCSCGFVQPTARSATFQRCALDPTAPQLPDSPASSITTGVCLFEQGAAEWSH